MAPRAPAPLRSNPPRRTESAGGRRLRWLAGPGRRRYDLGTCEDTRQRVGLRRGIQWLHAAGGSRLSRRHWRRRAKACSSPRWRPNRGRRSRHVPSERGGAGSRINRAGLRGNPAEHCVAPCGPWSATGTALAKSAHGGQEEEKGGVADASPRGLRDRAQRREGLPTAPDARSLRSAVAGDRGALDRRGPRRGRRKGNGRASEAKRRRQDASRVQRGRRSSSTAPDHLSARPVAGGMPCLLKGGRSDRTPGVRLLQLVVEP
mmetsp:Transcript_35393/g.97682  ORF Transcript_35393/g.97682 Transcript_35393/m.97682 type:complete len:261 (+) Transcript_35393:505-1287(+)